MAGRAGDAAVAAAAAAAAASSSAAAAAAEGSAAAPPPGESEADRRARRLAEVPEALREALGQMGAAEAEVALAFFNKEGLEGRTGSAQLVLETEAGGEAQIVLKLNYEERSWKRVRKKVKAA